LITSFAISSPLTAPAAPASAELPDAYMQFQSVISTYYSILVLNISAFTAGFTTGSHFSVKSMSLVVAKVVILNNNPNSVDEILSYLHSKILLV